MVYICKYSTAQKKKVQSLLQHPVLRVIYFQGIKIVTLKGTSQSLVFFVKKLGIRHS